MLPAYAGMIRASPQVQVSPCCAPRVCGDDPWMSYAVNGIREVLPAYAGMILLNTSPTSNGLCAPRVCGDDPGLKGDTADTAECSPRMRG